MKVATSWKKTPFEGINPGSCGVVILVYSGFIWFLSLPLNNAEVQSSIENALLASTSLRYRCQCRVSSLGGGVPLGSLITGHLSLPHHRSWRCSLRLASSFYAEVGLRWDMKLGPLPQGMEP